MQGEGREHRRFRTPHLTWMAWRRHSWPTIAEMGLTTYLAFVVLFPLPWLGLLTGDGLVLAGQG
ncbi:hypothetical protein CA951_04785 [Rhodococcus sp. NCIMB 12038]|nr:hypothetical protein CA951_04785 [Rhodococcus sp. NCIMB 12038]